MSSKHIEVSGKTEEEAIAGALEQLGMDRDEVSVEIVQRAKPGFLGIGTSPAVVKVSYEETDSVKDKAEAYLEGLLEKMGSDAAPEITEDDDGMRIELRGENLGVLIGRRGETLDAIQHLTNYTVNRGGEKRVRIIVDAENYRGRREETLVKLAEKVAGKVVKYRKNMSLEPMNSYERHVIHTALQGHDNVTTHSTGNEPNRRIIISYNRANPSPSDAPKIREWR